MKLQYLAIIFLIIILPIVTVLSVYVDYHIEAINLKHTYDTKLLDSTYDALKSYQLNTINNAISDISSSKIEELEAAVKTFYNSLTSTYGYTGYNSSVMKDYVPAVVFAMYDGYYIYSPYRNVLTGVPRTEDGGNYIDEDYADDRILYGIKPYVYYSCRYKINNENDFVITYTLDNYITVQGIVGGENVNKSGYLIDGIKQHSTPRYGFDTNGDGATNSDDIEVYDYEFDGVTFKFDSNEELTEFLGGKEYPYAKINGTKYYYDAGGAGDDDDQVFYINASGELARDIITMTNNENLFKRYKNIITKNNSAYRYYRDSYIFTTWVRENLGGLKASHALDEEGISILDFDDYTIFGFDVDDTDNTTSGVDATKFIQDLDSDFNAHRKAVIRYTIRKNLSTAIAGYNNFFGNAESDFVMPNLSETDWETVENNISMITFLQGFKIGGRDYNEYCVVANNLNKEYIDEKDIYILGDNRTYYKVNDKVLSTITLDNQKWVSGGGSGKNYAPGIWKLNFEKRTVLNDDAAGNYKKVNYFPISYKSGGDVLSYIGSYSSIISSTSIDSSETDIYKYMRDGSDTNNDGIKEPIDDKIKTTYYTALARERWGHYSVNNDMDIMQGTVLKPSTPSIIVGDTQPPLVSIVARTNDGNIYSGAWTNQNVILTATAIDNEKIASYNFSPNISNTVDITRTVNKVESKATIEDEEIEQLYTFYAKDKDVDGNTGTASTQVKIDKKKPEINNVIKNIDDADWTNGNVRISAKIKDGKSGVINYTLSKNDSIPETYDETISPTTAQKDVSFDVLSNDKYYIFVKDQAGNVSKREIEVDNIDKQAPIITVDPLNSEVCKNKKFTIEISDDLSGIKFDENNKVNGKAYLKSSTNEDEVKKEYSFAATKQSDKKAKVEVIIGENLTGKYKLYVTGDIVDKAGNAISEDYYINEYSFDNKEPEIELEIHNEDLGYGRQGKEVTINMIDEPAGVASNESICYLSTSMDYNSKVKEYNYKSGEKFRIGEGFVGKYYIWTASVSDKVGNVRPEKFLGEITFEEIIPDTEPPIVTVEPDSSEVCKDIDITITLEDELSGLLSNEGICYLSTNSRRNTKSVQYSYTSGVPINIGSGLTGTYYLWVGDVSDKEGNVNREHYVGTFIFDNTAPTISYFKTEDSDGTKVTLKTTASDVGDAGIAKYKYYVLNPETNTYKLASEIESTSTINSYIYDESIDGDKINIYVEVVDKVGNLTKSEELDIEFYRIIYDFNINTGEKLYDGTISDEKEFESTIIEEYFYKGKYATVYSKEAIKVDSREDIYSLKCWKDDAGNEYALHSEYTGKEDITLYAVWQKKSIKLPLDGKVNVNLYWQNSGIDIDTHTFTFEGNKEKHEIYYRKKTLGTAIKLDRDDLVGGKGENTLIDLKEIMNKYSYLDKIIMNARVYSGATSFKVVPNLRVIITDMDTSEEIFTYDLTKVNKREMTFGTLTKEEDYWLFEGGDSSIAN